MLMPHMLLRPGAGLLENTGSWLQDIVKAADAVVAAIDQTALARHVARETPEEGPGAKERKRQADEQKAALVDALEKKASALLEMQPAETDAASAGLPDESQARSARFTDWTMWARACLVGPQKGFKEWSLKPVALAHLSISSLQESFTPQGVCDCNCRFSCTQHRLLSAVLVWLKPLNL